MTRHEKLVQELFKPGGDILDSLTPTRCELLHAVLGISGEAGELLDAVKKHVIYCKPFDRVNIKEELGDLEFYMEALRQILNISREETLELNETKLRQRFGESYSNKAAQERIDKCNEPPSH